MDKEHEPSFKQCSMCHDTWESICSFIEDRSLELNGYQADFEDPAEGLIMVTHRKDGCHSTLALRAGIFADLYRGPTYTVHNTGKPTCTGKCLNEMDFTSCPAECNMKWVREVMQSFRTHTCPEQEPGEKLDAAPQEDHGHKKI